MDIETSKMFIFVKRTLMRARLALKMFIYGEQDENKRTGK